MSDTKKMQRLHRRSVEGGDLTAAETTALQNWYKTLDEQENSSLNVSHSTQNVSQLRKNLTQTTKQVTKISREIAELLKQNDALRKENQELKKSLESHLLEKVA